LFATMEPLQPEQVDEEVCRPARPWRLLEGVMCKTDGLTEPWDACEQLKARIDALHAALDRSERHKQVPKRMQELEDVCDAAMVQHAMSETKKEKALPPLRIP